VGDEEGDYSMRDGKDGEEIEKKTGRREQLTSAFGSNQFAVDAFAVPPRYVDPILPGFDRFRFKPLVLLFTQQHPVHYGVVHEYWFEKQCNGSIKY